ncbi:hypothetical protein [Bradyrhizobium sp. HKCCYLS20291]|uniref:hypothetical protein n=1 Tax=Bradyrhizobium sp. HKCCYLS20291 TaxID=3420766 RepID=UPI003EBB1C02
MAAAMAFVQTPAEFYTEWILRDFFEARFLHGVVFHLRYQYSSAKDGQVMATFMSARR